MYGAWNLELRCWFEVKLKILSSYNMGVVNVIESCLLIISTIYMNMNSRVLAVRGKMGRG